MRVIDSSIWIEIYRDSELGRCSLPLLATPETILVPTLVQHETYKWLLRETSAADADKAVMFQSNCLVVELSTAIAIEAAQCCLRHKLHTSDAIIYATALLHDAELMTCDAHFEGLAGVQYHVKQS